MVLALRWWASENVFTPRLASDNPRTVVTAYFDAQRWGLARTARRIESPEMRAYREAPNYVSPLINDVFLAGDLIIEGPNDIAAWNTYDEEVQFTVDYRSRWRSTIGERPGRRFWFVYLGRDEGGPWQVLGQGTGP
jgi:hypothetical protein